MIAECSLDFALQRGILMVMENERTLSYDALPGVHMMKKPSPAGGFVFGNPPQSDKTFSIDQVASSVCCVASLSLSTINCMDNGNA